MNFVAKRFWFFVISISVITPGIIFLIMAPGLKPGIDFTGGSSMTLQFPEGTDVSAGEIRETLDVIGYSESTVQNLGNANYFLRTKELQDEEKESLVTDLTDLISDPFKTIPASRSSLKKKL